MNLKSLKKILQKDLKKTRSRKKTCFFYILLFFLSAVFFVLIDFRPVRLLQQGISFEQKEQFDQALTVYRQVIEKDFPDQEKATALFRTAQIYQHDQKNDQLALFYYLRLEKEYPETELLNEARKESAALLKFQNQDCRQAISFYQRLIEENSPQADRYQYEIADCYARLGNWAQSAIEFETLINTYENSALFPLALYRYANSLLLNQQRDAARAALQKLNAQNTDQKLAMEAGFRLAEMLEEEGKNRAALEAFTALGKGQKSDRILLKIEQLKKRINEKKRIQ
jgi:TolA-binding protein